MNALALVRPLAASLYRFQKAKTSAFRDYKRDESLQTMNVLAIVRLLASSAYRFRKGKTSVMSFGGRGTRPGFTDFLYRSRMLKDDSVLPVGEQIGLEVPVLRYAQSKRCLGKLNEIMDCHIEHGESVLPKVDVVDLGCQCGNSEEAPCEHEMQCRREDAREWVEALWSRIRGWMSQVIPNGVRGRKESNSMPHSSVGRHERQLVNMVVARVLSESSDQGKKRRECQVFLTFGCPDARYNLAGSLYTSLLAKGIKVLTNDDLIGKNGHQIRNAIVQCKISIPILCKNFAYSHWCLKELAHMVECKRTKGQKILPIFYKVESSHVRDISHLFGEYMLRYKELADEDSYEQCERAIRELGSFEGWVSEKIANGVLVNQVVKEVARLLNLH